MSRPSHAAASEESREEERGLLARARAGDQGAFAELYRRHHGGAMRYTSAIADWHEAEDVVAEAFMRTLGALQRNLGPDTGFRAYLFTAIRSIWINMLRRQSRGPSLLGTVDLVMLEEPPPEVTDWPDENMQIAFRKLRPRWREVLWLSEVVGYPRAQVADHFGLSQNALAALHFRACEALRREYLELLDATRCNHRTSCRRTTKAGD